MKNLSAKEAQKLDQYLQKFYGIHSLILMENAGRWVAEEILKIPACRQTGKKRKIAIFCGKGNNGGDGFVCARHLLVKEIKPDVFLVGKIKDTKFDAKTNLEILRKLTKVREILSLKDLAKINFKKYNLIVDALLGVGLRGEVVGLIKNVIEKINQSKILVLAIDIPSGLDATSGKVLGTSIKAQKTITFLAKKRGMVFGEGPKVCGKVIVRDLGIGLI